MQLNLQFNFNRFWHLIKNDVVTNYRTLLTAAGAALGILLFINFISMLSTSEPAVALVFYPLILFIGGYLITSMSFSDLHHPNLAGLESGEISQQTGSYNSWLCVGYFNIVLPVFGLNVHSQSYYFPRKSPLV